MCWLPFFGGPEKKERSKQQSHPRVYLNAQVCPAPPPPAPSFRAAKPRAVCLGTSADPCIAWTRVQRAAPPGGVRRPHFRRNLPTPVAWAGGGGFFGGDGRTAKSTPENTALGGAQGFLNMAACFESCLGGGPRSPPPRHDGFRSGSAGGQHPSASASHARRAEGAGFARRIARLRRLKSGLRPPDRLLSALMLSCKP